jgi:quinol monooxygenase YgiN
MITVIAKLPIKEGKVEEVSGVFKTLMLNVAKEEGTLLYSLNKEKSKCVFRSKSPLDSD